MTGIEIVNIIEVATEQFKKAGLLDGRGRTGGYLCVADSLGILLVCQIGDLDAAKAFQYFTVCQEKAKRLMENGHISSWQSRDPDTKKYGGGVRTDNDVIFSFSGLTEHLDEALTAAVASLTKARLSPERWAEISEISRNPYMNNYGRIAA